MATKMIPLGKPPSPGEWIDRDGWTSAVYRQLIDSHYLASIPKGFIPYPGVRDGQELTFMKDLSPMMTMVRDKEADWIGALLEAKR